jgi:hypothetical protein
MKLGLEDSWQLTQFKLSEVSVMASSLCGLNRFKDSMVWFHARLLHAYSCLKNRYFQRAGTGYREYLQMQNEERAKIASILAEEPLLMLGSTFCFI